MTKEHVYNRNILYLIILFILVVSGFGLKYYSTQKKENSALRIKIITLNKTKKTPLPWSRLTQQSIETINKKTLTPTPAPTLIPVAKLVNEIPIIEQSTEQLSKSLTENMQNLKSLDLATVDKNIEIADEIISREPASYSAYKAKLISLLVKESKFDQSIDDYEINKVLDNMAGFEVANDNTARREAALIASTNNQLMALENTLDDISILRDEISTQSSAIDRSSPEYEALQNQNQQLINREVVSALNLESLQNNINNGALEPVYLNEDVVEIPFLRLIAKNDYDSVIENADSFIEQFPNSPTGYFYLVKALGFQGRADDAIRVIEETKLSPEAQSDLMDRLDATSGDDPKSYWEKLRF